jgi:hypothetical protein
MKRTVRWKVREQRFTWDELLVQGRQTASMMEALESLSSAADASEIGCKRRLPKASRMAPMSE